MMENWAVFLDEESEPCDGNGAVCLQSRFETLPTHPESQKRDLGLQCMRGNGVRQSGDRQMRKGARAKICQPFENNDFVAVVFQSSMYHLVHILKSQTTRLTNEKPFWRNSVHHFEIPPTTL